MPLLDKYNTFIVDFDGTLTLENKLIDGAREFLNHLLAIGKNLYIVTNKTINSQHSYVSFLNDNGVIIKSENLISATTITANYLKNNYKSNKFYAIAEENLIENIKSGGLDYSDNPEEIDIVVISLDRKVNDFKLRIAEKALTFGARFFAANTDLTCPVIGGEIEDAGVTIEKLEQRTGRKLELFFGKPSTFMIDYVMKKVDDKKNEIVIIGDRLSTDIQMAKNAGIDSIHIKSKIKELHSSNIEATYSVSSISELIDYQNLRNKMKAAQ